MSSVVPVQPAAVQSLLTMKHQHGPAHASDFGPSSFLREAPAGSSIADSLQGHPHQQDLAAYVPAFEAAQVDVQLASSMDSADYHRLLPDAPLGHVLMLRQAILAAAEPRVQLPAASSWSIPSRTIASTAEAGELSSSLVISLELTMLVSSLLLAISSSFMMGPRTECGAGGNSTLTESQCQKLRAADAYVWAVASVLLFSAICLSWLYAYCMRAVGKNHLARWCEDTASFYFLGIICPFCLGVSCFAIGLGIRGVLVTADSTLPSGLPLLHAGVWGASALSLFAYWFALTSRTTGLRWGKLLLMREWLACFVSFASR